MYSNSDIIDTLTITITKYGEKKKEKQAWNNTKKTS